jgi:pimeloyl-ACP methyl ester carboxylesterase
MGSPRLVAGLRQVAALACVVMLAFAGCAGRSYPDPADTSMAGQAPGPDRRCAGGPSRPYQRAVLTTVDGVKLAAVRTGSGPHGVVLIHEDHGDVCSWWTYAVSLADAGFHVLVFDLRCFGFSECGETRDYVADVTAAVADLRAAGARRVNLVGIDLGAGVALVSAGHLAPAGQVDGVVSISARSPNAILSAAPDSPGPSSPGEAARFLTVPLLLCFAAQDGTAMTDAELYTIFNTAPSTTKRVVRRPGASHGSGMLAAVNGGAGPDDVTAEVLAFLRAHA